MNEQEPTPETPKSRQTRPEPKTTALVPTEPDVIEGEVVVIEPSDAAFDHRLRKPKPYWLLIPITILACCLFLAASILLPLFTPTATVIIMPTEQSFTTIAAIKVHARLLPALTLSQSVSVPATGKRHLSATRAVGMIIFYNGLFIPQSIAQGTVLTGIDGVQVVTDTLAVIPAGHPPSYGQVTVTAHAVIEGVSGNIQAFDINQACCATSVLAKNTSAFTGGEEARDYLVVTKSDLEAAKAAIKPTLLKSEQAAMLAQIAAGESLTPPLCSEKVTSDHQAGEEAKEVTVTVSDTCLALALASREVDQDAAKLLTVQAKQTLGVNYSLIGDIQVTIIHVIITNSRQGQATIMVQITGTFVYQITPNIKYQLLHLLSGKSKEQALALLFLQPGIKGAQIRVQGGNLWLPDDPRNIHLLVVY